MILLDVQDQLLDFIKDRFGEAFAIASIAGAVIISLVVWLSIFLYKVISRNKENAKDIQRIQKDVDACPCKEHDRKLERVVAVEKDLELRPCKERIVRPECVAAIDKKMSELPCGDHLDQIRKHTEGHSKVLQDLESIKTSIKYMNKGIDGLGELLQKKNIITSGIFTQSHSPLSITDEGKNMMERIGAQKMFDNNWPRISNYIKENNESPNPYDIQQFCIQQAVVFPEKFLSEEELDKIKIDAYSTGNPLLSYMRVFAVLARDRYFEENGIDPSGIDTRQDENEAGQNISENYF